MIIAITAVEWISAAAVLVVTVLIAVLTRRIVHRIAKQLGIHRHITDLAIRLLVMIVLAVGGYITLTVLGIELGPLLGALGVSGLIVAFALQSLVANLVGGLVLEAGRPFRVGDQISTNDHTGTVIDINSRTVVILTYDGTHVHVPNSSVLAEPMENFTREPIRRTQLPVQLPYDCDLVAGARILARTLRSIPDIEESPPPDALAESFNDSGVDFVLRFWHASEEITARLVISEVVMTVHRNLLEGGIEIPFPQRVIHLPSAATDTELGGD